MTVHDPITGEIIGNFLLSISEEMTAVLIRSAYSANIKERADCSSAILTPEGEVVVQAAHSPLHLGGMQGTARALLAAAAREDLRPGDMYVSNDPHLAAALHLNDVTIAAPLIVDGQLFGFVATVAHHADLGGSTPGGEACDSKSIFDEGLRLPPTRIAQNGEPIQSVLDILFANSRNPREILGDFRAQFSAVKLGTRRFEDAVVRWGADTVRSAVKQVLSAAESRFRAAVTRLPNGVYECTDWADDDWVTGESFPVHAKVEIRDDEVHVDLTKNIDQVESSRNVSAGMLLATVLTSMQSAIDPFLPANSGFGRAIHISTRPGSILAPHPPAAVALGSRTCQILFGAIYGALSEVVPERICAGCATAAGIQVFGPNPHTGAPFLNYERVGGGFGARSSKDGLDGVQFGVTNTSNLPIEASEAEYPFMVEAYEVIPDSGGVGQFRGGLGVRRDIRVLTDGAVLTAQGERIVNPPPGLRGGLPGRPGQMLLNPGTRQEKVLPTAFSGLKLSKGDVIGLRTAGGGGFGDPSARDTRAIEEDLENGRVTIDAAKRDYGYVPESDD